MAQNYDVTLCVRVTDYRALMKAARDKAEESGCRRGDVKDAAEALRWLLDTGSDEENGYRIADSTCEAVP